uniref:ATP synthase F0 subunit 8 n=1 Tax=Panagrolaimus sp. JU765 TaxID=591449 RepID=A0AC34Q9G2_9BILA
MTGLIAVWIVFLYLTGMLCVLYMMLKKYPPIEFNDELNGIPFSKMDSRVSFESTIPNIPQIMEVKC